MFPKKSNSVPPEKECFNDPKSFEHIYRKYAPKIYGLCYHKLRDEELAREIVQEIFKSLWEKKDTLKISSSLEHYLIRAAKYKVIDQIREKISHHSHITFMKENISLSDNYTEHDFLYNNLTGKVNQLIEQLPLQCRNVYCLSREKGMSVSEIAAALLISEFTVKNHLKKALNYLRKNLPEYVTVLFPAAFIAF